MADLETQVQEQNSTQPLEEARKAIETLKENYRQSFFDFAKNGFLDMLSLCLLQLTPEQEEAVLSSYPKELKKMLDENKAKQDKSSLIVINGSLYNRAVSFVLSMQANVTAEDYLALEDSVSLLNEDDYQQLLNENNPEAECSFDCCKNWIYKKLPIFCNNLSKLEELPPFKLQSLCQSFSEKDFLAIYSFAPEKTKELIFSGISKNNRRDLLEAFCHRWSYQSDYLEAVKKINDFISNYEDIYRG